MFKKAVVASSKIPSENFAYGLTERRTARLRDRNKIVYLSANVVTTGYTVLFPCQYILLVTPRQTKSGATIILKRGKLYGSATVSSEDVSDTQ
jgi:hypothetical protein